MKRTNLARRSALIATIALALALFFALLFWKQSLEFVQTYDAAFKLVGLGIGPLLAVLGFFWGLVDKAELKDLAEQLGQEKSRAEKEKLLAQKAEEQLNKKTERIESLEADLEAIADSSRLWRLRSNHPFAEYKGWKHDPAGAKIITISLFKGGVGKTHLSANFAAYVSERQKKPVLVLDLDYQGSLSVTLLTAAGIDPVGSNIDSLFSPDADLATLNEKRLHLAKYGPETVLNRGNGLSRAWLVPSDYTLAEVESKLLIQRVIHNSAGLDERYRLAHLLLHPNVRREYGAIILDTPPRMTLGTVNAFVASHFYVVPAILDKVSSEAIRPFLSQVEALKTDLDLNCKLAGIVGTLTRQMDLSDSELFYREQISNTAKAVLRVDRELVIPQNLPRKTQVTSDDDLGYFLRDDKGHLKDRFYDTIFDELWARMA